MKSLDFIFKEAIPPQQTAPTARRVNVMNPQSYSVPTPQPAAAPIVNRDINKPDALGRIQQLAGTAPAETPAGVVSSDGQPVRDGSGQQVQAGHTVPVGNPGAAQLPNAGLPPVKQPVDPNSVDSADAAAGQAAQAAVDQQNLANMDMQVGQGAQRGPSAATAPNTATPAAAPAAAVKPGETVDTWREPSGTSQTTFTPPAAGTKPQVPTATTAPAAPAAAAGGYPGGISQADAEKKYGKTGAEIIRLGGMDAYNNRPKDAAGNLALLKQLQTGKAPAAGGSTAAAPSQPRNPLYGTPNDPRQGRGYGQQTAPTATAAAPKATPQPNPASANATVPYDVARATPAQPAGGSKIPAAASAPAATPANTSIKSTTSATLSGDPQSHPNYQTYLQQELAKNNRGATATGQQIAATMAANRVQKELAQAKSGEQISVNGAPPVQIGGGQAPASQTLKQGAQSKIASPFVMSNLNKNPNNFIVEYNKMTSVEKMQYLRSIITEAPKPLSQQAQQWQALRAQQLGNLPTSSLTTPTGATSTTITGTGAPAAGTPPPTGSGAPATGAVGAQNLGMTGQTQGLSAADRRNLFMRAVQSEKLRTAALAPIKEIKGLWRAMLGYVVRYGSYTIITAAAVSMFIKYVLDNMDLNFPVFEEYHKRIVGMVPIIGDWLGELNFKKIQTPKSHAALAALEQDLNEVKAIMQGPRFADKMKDPAIRSKVVYLIVCTFNGLGHGIQTLKDYTSDDAAKIANIDDALAKSLTCEYNQDGGVNISKAPAPNPAQK